MACPRNHLQPLDSDGPAAFLTRPVVPLGHFNQGVVDLADLTATAKCDLFQHTWWFQASAHWPGIGSGVPDLFQPSVRFHPQPADPFPAAYEVFTQIVEYHVVDHDVLLTHSWSKPIPNCYQYGQSDAE